MGGQVQFRQVDEPEEEETSPVGAGKHNTFRVLSFHKLSFRKTTNKSNETVKYSATVYDAKTSITLMLSLQIKRLLFNRV